MLTVEFSLWYKFLCLPGPGEDGHAPDQQEWLAQKGRGSAPAFMSQDSRELSAPHTGCAQGRSLVSMAVSLTVCLCVPVWAHVCVQARVWRANSAWVVTLRDGEHQLLKSSGKDQTWPSEFSRCRVRGLVPSATTQIRPQVAVGRQWNHLFFWFCWLLFLTMLDGQEEPEGKVVRAATTNFLAQKPHSPGSFLFARGELEGGTVGMGEGRGRLFPYSFKVLQHFKEDKEDIFSSAQAQPSYPLFFSIGLGQRRLMNRRVQKEGEQNGKKGSSIGTGCT